MKTIIATFIASVAFAAAAFAGEAEGVVKAYDAATKTVTLEDATTYVVADGVAVDTLVAGAKVKVTFDDATKAATAIEVTK